MNHLLNIIIILILCIILIICAYSAGRQLACKYVPDEIDV